MASNKYIFLVTVIYTASTFTGTFTAEARVPEHSLSFLEGFVEGDFTVQKRVVKRSLRDISENKKVPKYMLELFELLENRRFQIKFDKVHSIPCEDVSEMRVSHSQWSMDSNFYRFIFNTSHFPHSDSVLLAQLRIQSVQPIEEKRFETTRIDTFSFLETPSSKLSSRDFDPNTESLYTVDITKSFQEVLYSDKKHLVLVLTIPYDIKDFLILDPLSTEGPQLLVMSKTVVPHRLHEDNIPTRMRRSPYDYITKPKSEFPSSSGAVEEFPILLENNSSKALRESEDEDEKQVSSTSRDLGRTRKGKHRMKKNGCQRKPMNVNFADIHHDWVVAPEDYNAGQCSGRCSIPTNITPPITNYALIQTLMHNLHPQQVSRPCCVPTELGAQQLLIRVPGTNTVIMDTSRTDMVVLKCGCANDLLPVKKL